MENTSIVFSLSTRLMSLVSISKEHDGRICNYEGAEVEMDINVPVEDVPVEDVPEWTRCYTCFICTNTTLKKAVIGLDIFFYLI